MSMEFKINRFYNYDMAYGIWPMKRQGISPPLVRSAIYLGYYYEPEKSPAGQNYHRGIFVWKEKWANLIPLYILIGYYAVNKNIIQR